MIAMPFHPSNAYTIREFKKSAREIISQVEKNAREIFDYPDLEINLKDMIDEEGEVFVTQAVVAGCAGGSFENISVVSDILKGHTVGSEGLTMSVYPASQPIYLDLIEQGVIASLMKSGVITRSAFCGPCFGAGDVPQNGGFSIRHTTRNFPNREGSVPAEGQIAYVALMDSKSIAATVVNGGKLTSAEDIDFNIVQRHHNYDDSSYKARVFNGFGKADSKQELIFGPNIKDWPEFPSLKKDLLVKVASFITDEVTTTDELIPSGETASYRSNPFKLAEFTLSRKDPKYVGRSKKIRDALVYRDTDEFKELLGKIEILKSELNLKIDIEDLSYGSGIYANKPGDGSAREQASSCQKILGGVANIALEYATKRYRSNLINWGIIPFTVEELPDMEVGDYIYIPDILEAISADKKTIKGYILSDTLREINLSIGNTKEDEKRILKEG